MFSGFGLSFCQSVATAPLLIAADKNVCLSYLSLTSGINKIFSVSSRLSVNTCVISFNGYYLPSNLYPINGINKQFDLSSLLSVNTCSITFDGSYITSQSEKHSLIKSTVNNIIDCSFAGWPLLQSVDHQNHDEHR